MTSSSAESTNNIIMHPEESDKKSYLVSYIAETPVKSKLQGKRKSVPSDNEAAEDANGISKSDLDNSDEYLREPIYISEGGSITKSYGSLTKSKLSRSTVFSGITGVISRSR